jgi:NAD(P)-dependent dehydrogenase (short-subunit alcohol dehydrogenase family)
MRGGLCPEFQEHIMKIILIGATGTIGNSIAQALADHHELIRVSRSKAEHRVDLASKDSIQRLMEEVQPFDAVISAAGQAAFRPLPELSDDDFQLSLSNKLMGQVNLLRIGLRYIKDGGSQGNSPGTGHGPVWGDAGGGRRQSVCAQPGGAGKRRNH